MSGLPAYNGSHDLFDGFGTVAQQMASFEDGLSSPPGGPECHPPGSPKPAREHQQLQHELMRSRKEAEHFKTMYEDVKKKLNWNDSLEPKVNGEGSSQDNTVDEDLRDSEIRLLQRKVTILTAEVYKNEGLEQRMKDLTKEKSKLEKDLSDGKQCIKNLEQTIRLKQEEISRLMNEAKGDKERISQLEKRKQELSPPSSHQPSSVSLQSLSSNPNYQRELDHLHAMVDTLKSTVMEQRNVFVKMGFQSRPFNSMPPGHHSNHLAAADTKPTQTRSAPIARSFSPPSSRVAEESSEKTPTISDIRTFIPEDMVVNGQHPHNQQYKLSNNAVTGTGSSTLDGPPASTTAKQLIQEYVGSGNLVNGMEDLHVKISGVNGGSSPRKLRQHTSVTNMSNSTSENHHIGALYENVEGAGVTHNLHQRGPTGGTPMGAQFQGNMIPHVSNSNSSPKIPPRKTSQSEIINRRPLIETAALPVKSQTEVIAKNPNLIGQLQPQPVRNAGLPLQVQPQRPQYLPAMYPHADFLQLDGAQRNPIGGSVNRNPGVYPPQSNHSGTSNQISNATNYSVKPQAGNGPDDSRLCPVCNQNFIHMSLENFQNHVLNCFDDGPETIQPQDIFVNNFLPNMPFPAHRTCPMCEVKFDTSSMSQTEFEQHVHHHFGEEPFEVLGR